MRENRNRTARRSSYGTASIRREKYNTQSGWNKKSGWFDTIRLVEARSRKQCETIRSGHRCLNPAVEVHHIIPLSRGGTNNMLNLIHVCLTCHALRHGHLFRQNRFNASSVF